MKYIKFYIFLLAAFFVSVYVNSQDESESSETSHVSSKKIIDKISSTSVKPQKKILFIQLALKLKLKFDDFNIITDFLLKTISDNSLSNDLRFQSMTELIKCSHEYKLIWSDNDVKRIQKITLEKLNADLLLKNYLWRDFVISNKKVFNSNFYDSMGEYCKKANIKSTEDAIRIFALLDFLVVPSEMEMNPGNEKYQLTLDDYEKKQTIVYYDVINKSTIMLLIANQYPKYSEWKNFCFCAEEYLNQEKWKALVLKRIDIFKKTKDLKALEAYLNFLIKNEQYELCYIPRANISTFEKISEKYSEIKLLCEKVIDSIKKNAHRASQSKGNAE